MAFCCAGGTCNELDGWWRLSIHYPPPLVSVTEAKVVVMGGRCAGVDSGGCTFTSALSRHPDGTIRFVSTWDASQADEDVFLLTPQGRPTRARTEMTCALDITVADAAVTAIGTVPAGSLTLELRFERLEDRF